MTFCLKSHRKSSDRTGQWGKECKIQSSIRHQGWLQGRQLIQPRNAGSWKDEEERRTGTGKRNEETGNEVSILWINNAIINGL